MTELDDATTQLDQAEAAHYRAEALAEMADQSGVRWRALDPSLTTFGVTKDGVFIGEIKPEWPGRQLGNWTAYTADGVRLEDGFPTGRAAAAALAAHVER